MVKHGYAGVNEYKQVNMSTVYISYIKILVVRLCVCDGCGRGRNEFAGRVQNHHVRLDIYNIIQRYDTHYHTNF